MAEKLVTFSEGKEPPFPSNYEVTKRVTLNFTDIIDNHNKFYNLEVQVAPSGVARIYTTYGRTGGTITKDYRVCKDRSHAELESDKIIKSKNKKGYVEVKLIKSDVGSEAGKAKIDSSVSVESLKKMGVSVTETKEDSKLHPEVQDLVRTWFGVTQEFIELNLDTKKCPLGQLSIDQLDLAKKILEEARTHIHLKKPDTQELNKLTNQYYSNIPHNFGYRKIDANALRFDKDDKIDHAYDMLDVFSDAKNIQGVISKKSAIDSQYKTLNAELDFIDPTDPIWKWVDTMVLGTRASNHSGLGKLKTHKIFKVNRHKENDNWLMAAESIAKECGKYVPSEVYAKYLSNREDVPKEYSSLYKAANILPSWHGTRRANMIGITTKGLLIRPSGVAHAGSMYGDGIYWAVHSTKSMNYCDVKGSYWAQGTNKTAYLFLADVAFGNQKIVAASKFYTKSSIKPNHSVWAKSGGGSGLYNDELVTYEPTGPNQQHKIRYIIEFETQAK